MLRLLPGVIDTQNREAPGWNNLGGLSINGGRNNTINLTYDGVTNLDTGSNTGPFLAPGLDSIAEIKVLTSNYQAEYGRSSGGTINVVTKSGTPRFRGGGFYAKRDDALNANEWQNNKFDRDKPPYKFDYSGYNIGGPIVLPNFNSGRNKLFFFWNQEFLPRTNPGSLTRRLMPTEAERRGDFSQSIGTNGQLLVVRDPTTGQPFPGNVIPANRIDRNGQALLNLFPTPNFSDPTRQANYTFQSSFDQPRNDQVLRVDWNVAPSTLFYSRLNFGYEAYKGGWGFVLNNANWPQLPIAYEIHSYGIVNTVLHTFSPTTVMEVTVGLNHGKQTVEPLTQADLERNDRTKVGLSGSAAVLPGGQSRSRIVPNADFGVSGLASAAREHADARRRGPVSVLRRERHLELVGEPDQGVGLPQHEGGDLLRVHDAAGRALEPVQRTVQLRPQYGEPARRRITRTPTRCSVPSTATTKPRSHPDANAQFTNFEWFIQDSWRVRPNLTIDGGIRFYRIGPTRSRDDQLAVFQPDTFNLANAPLLIQPVNTADGRRGLNPLTGEILPAVKIGTFVPNSGNPTNGTQVYDESILNTPAIQVAPRIGFCVGRDGGRPHRRARRLRHLPRSLQRRHRPADGRTAAARPVADGELHDDQRTAVDAAQPQPGDGALPQPELQAAADQELEHRRAARSRLQAGRGRQLCRVDRARMLQTRSINAVPYGSELPAVEHRSDDGRPAAGQLPASI